MLKHLHRYIFTLTILVLALAVISGCGGEQNDSSNYSPYLDITIKARKADTHTPLVDADVVIEAAGSGGLAMKTDSTGTAVFRGVDTAYRKVHVTIQGSDDDPYYGQWLNVDFSTGSSRVFDVPRVAP